MAGEFKYKNEPYAIENTPNIGSLSGKGTDWTISGVPDPDGNIYYLYGDFSLQARQGAQLSDGNNQGSLYIRKIDTSGTITSITSINARGVPDKCSPVGGYIGVPYTRGGVFEIHFVLPMNAYTGLFEPAYNIRYIPSTDSISFFSTSNCRVDGLAFGTYDIDEFGLQGLKIAPVWLDGDLYYVYFGVGGYTIQKYSPVSYTWLDICTNATFNGTDSARFTVFSRNSKIYILTLGPQGGGNHYPYFWSHNVEDNTTEMLANTGYFGSGPSTSPPIICNATPMVIGDVAYMLGGAKWHEQAVINNVMIYTFSTNTWANTAFPNTVNFASPCNAINLGGEVIFLGHKTGGSVSTSVTKFTYVLENIAGFTATYVPSTSSIQLSWTDNSEESFYIIERNVNNGGWEQIATKDAGVLTHTVTGIDIMANHYSFRIKAGKIVVL